MPSQVDIEARVNALSDHAQAIGLDPLKLELRNSEGAIKAPSRLKDIINNADIKVANLQEQADIAVDELDARASIATATMTQAQAEFLSRAHALLTDETPGVDAAKLQQATVAMGAFKDTSDFNAQVAATVDAHRLEMYSGEIKTATEATLKARGFTDAEVQTFATATTKQLMAGQADLKSTLEMAQPIAQAMNQNLQNCTTRISEFNPGASKIHDAVAQSFNTVIKVAPDGERSLKPKLEGNETGTFSLSKANQFVQEAAADNQVTLRPALAPHQQNQPGALNHVGGSLTADKSGQAMAGQQASVTFKVKSDVALDDAGTSLGFAKRGFGAKTAELKSLTGSKEVDIIRSEFKDNELAGTAAPLFGTSRAVAAAADIRETMRVIGGDLNTLQSRAVASSAVNKALGMDNVAEEKIGVDEDRRTLGVSVAVPGAPILTRPDAADQNEAFLNVDYDHPDIQRGLSDLEVQDYITGQIDRHAGNIFIDPTTNEVRGIDNDLAFPTVDREVMLTDPNLSAKAVRGMPQIMHEDTAQKIESLSPQELRATLQNLSLPGGTPGLEPAAIDGAVARLENLQAEIKNMRADGRIVTEFNADTYQAARQTQLEQCNPEFRVGERGNAGVARTSYLGSAIMEKERTLELAQSRNALDHRTMLTADDMRPLPVNEQYVAYKNGVEAAKNDLLQNPHKIGDMRVAADVGAARKQVADLESQLAAQTQDLQSMKSTVAAIQRGVESPQQQARLAQAREALQVSQVERQTTLQDLSLAKKQLAASLDQAVSPMKAQISRTTGLPVLQQQLEAANQRVQTAQATVEAFPVSRFGNHRQAPAQQAAQTELVKAQQEAEKAQAKLDFFQDATQGDRVSVSQGLGLGRQRSNSAPAVNEPAVAPRQNSTRAMFGQHRQAAANQAQGQGQGGPGLG